jgi:uncharacterized cupredoxin-like copper-binding protein
VKKGETVRFVVKNSGRLKHDGARHAKELREHAVAYEEVPGDGMKTPTS